jgi:hypothetical protein
MPKTQERTEICLKCKYWDTETKDPNDFEAPGIKAQGRACRFNPVVIYKLPNEWCGQFKAS